MWIFASFENNSYNKNFNTYLRIFSPRIFYYIAVFITNVMINSTYLPSKIILPVCILLPGITGYLVTMAKTFYLFYFIYLFIYIILYLHFYCNRLR